MWITPEEKSFESKTLWQRFLVIFAGPLMNFILALFLFLIISFFVLKPNLESNEIQSVTPGSPAFDIGVESGDFITEINGQPVDSWETLGSIMTDLKTANLSILYTREGVPQSGDSIAFVQIVGAGLANFDEDGQRYSQEPIIGTAYGRASSEGKLASGDRILALTIGTNQTVVSSWDDIILFFSTQKEGTVEVEFLRDGSIETTTYRLISHRAIEKLGHTPILIQMGIRPTESFDFAFMITYPFRQVYSDTMSVINTIGLLFDPNEDLGLRDLSGPVGIFSLVSSTTSQGLLPIIAFTAFLSINIGLLNLLPIPALDGGRLVFLGIEAVTRKPLNRKLENTINNLMFLLLMGLFIFVTFNDILKLFGG